MNNNQKTDHPSTSQDASAKLYIFKKGSNFDSQEISLNEFNFVPSINPIENILTLNSSLTGSNWSSIRTTNMIDLRDLLILEIKQLFTDQETRILLSDEIPVIYETTYHIKIPNNWFDLIKESNDDFYYDETIFKGIYHITRLI